MIEFVFDEMISDQDLVDKCNSEKDCVTHSYPARLRSKKDFEMLPDLLSGDCILVTNDVRIAEENSSYIPEINSGLIVVRLRRSSKSMTSRLTAELLGRFKSKFPLWPQVSWRGVRLEITECEVFLSPLSPNLPDERVVAEYNSDSFVDELLAALNRLLPHAAGE